MVWPRRFQRNRKNASRKRKPAPRRPRKQSLGRLIGSTVYQVMSALPFIPAPIKSVADVIANQFGFATKKYDAVKKTYTVSATPVGLVWLSELSATAFICGTPYCSFNEAKCKAQTNYRSCRPRTITITVSPSNQMQYRQGYYSVAFFPYTGPGDSATVRTWTTDNIGWSRIFQRAPIKKRVPATQRVTLTYNVPTSNTYLHMGLPLLADGIESKTDVVGAIYISYECDDRITYENFTPADCGIDVRLNLIGEFMHIDPVETMTINCGYRLYPLTKGTVSYVDADWKKIGTSVIYDGAAFTYKEDQNCMIGTMTEEAYDSFVVVSGKDCMET